MFSSHWAPAVALTVKAVALALGMTAAGVGLWAAHLWLKASRIKMPPIDPPVASIEDAPALHIMSTDVQLTATTQALENSAGEKRSQGARVIYSGYRSCQTKQPRK